MRATTEEDVQREYTWFELFEFALFEYLKIVDTENLLPRGVEGPNSNPLLFRSIAITALSNAREKFATEEGHRVIQKMRSEFKSTSKALRKYGLDDLDKSATPDR